jgi:hypothetical protein
MLIAFSFCYGQLNMESNFTYTMMLNTLEPKCNEQWVQMCIHQFQSNPTSHVGASLGPSLGETRPQLSTKSMKSFKIKALVVGYKLVFTKLCLKPPLHLHHHVGKLHPISMDCKRPLHNVGRSSTSSTFGKIDFQSHLQCLMAIQMMDLVIIKHVIPMFS